MTTVIEVPLSLDDHSFEHVLDALADEMRTVVREDHDRDAVITFHDGDRRCRAAVPAPPNG